MENLGTLPGYRLAVQASYDDRYSGLDAADVALAARHPAGPVSVVLEEADLPSSGRLLDVGCGPGVLALAAALARPGLAVTGTDLSEGGLALARAAAAQLGTQGTFLSGDAERPPSGPFDRITATALLALLPDRVAALAEWRAVLAPGGRIVLADGLARDGAVRGPGPLPLEGLQGLAAEAGLRLLRVRDCTTAAQEAQARGEWWWGEYLRHGCRYAVAVLVP